jgi:hypothetical protein
MISSDLAFLLAILDSILSTDIVAAPAPAPDIAALSSSSLSASGASEDEPAMFEGILLSPSNKQRTPTREAVRVEVKQVAIKFGIEKLKVSLLHKAPTDTAAVQVISAKLEGLQADLEKQTSKVRIDCSPARSLERPTRCD